MPLALGRTRRNAVVLTDEERSRHVHVIGASGTGKSKLIESMIRQDILAGRGLCLIDPHGTLADGIVQWCTSRNLNNQRRIHVIEPGDLSWCAGFNPLRLDGFTETAVRVDAMVAACAQVWGGENTSTTPLLKKCLRAVFYTLAVRELTLAEAPLLTSSESDLRRALITDLPDPVFGAVWRDFDALSRREFFEQFSSTNNRLLEFLSSPVIRRIVGQRENALDLKQVMDNGEIVIVNLASKGTLSADNGRLLGTLLTSELFLQAVRRDEAMARSRPFTLYIDECYDYLTSDVERMLDQTRKFGLHLVLAHQRLGQLRDRSEAIYNGVMAGGQTKIVFGGLTDDDAEILAREVLRTSFNLEQPKHILDKPVVVDEVAFWRETESDTITWSKSGSTTDSHGYGSSSSLTEGMSDHYNSEGDVSGTASSIGETSGSSESWGRSSSETTSEGGSRTRGRSQGEKAVRVMMPTTVFSLEEATHLAIIRLRELPNRAAIVRRRGKRPVRFRTPDIMPGLASDGRIEGFMETTRTASPYLSVADEADAEIAARATRLRAAPAQSPGDDTSFWSEEK